MAQVMAYDDDRYYDIDGNPITLNEWALIGNTHVGKTHMDGYFVSTVHLGLNHAFDGGPHLTFETMIFTDDGNMNTPNFPEFPEYQTRYHTLEEAKAGHEEACKWLRRTEVWK